MNNHRRTTAISVLVLVFAATMTGCGSPPPPPPPPPPTTDLHHVTTWQGDVAHPDTQPELVSWIGYGAFAHNTGMIACEILPGGGGWTQTFTRVDAGTVRVTITLDWMEGDNDGAGYGCGINDLNVGLRDADNTEVAFAVLPLISHT